MMQQCLRWKPVGWDALRPSILAVEFLKYSFDLDLWMDAKVR